MSASAVTRWWWVRHAPVTVNKGCCYGQTDLPCETDERHGFTGLAKRLPSPASWVVTPLKRTHMTASALIAAGLDGPRAVPGPDTAIEPDLIEQDFGDWQGQRYDDLAKQRGDAWHRFWLAPAQETPPGGESFVQLMARVHAAIARLNQRFIGRDIVAVTHGGTIRAALALALDLAPEAALAFTIDNLSLTRLDHFPEPGLGHGWRVGVVNQPPV